MTGPPEKYLEAEAVLKMAVWTGILHVWGWKLQPEFEPSTYWGRLLPAVVQCHLSFETTGRRLSSTAELDPRLHLNRVSSKRRMVVGEQRGDDPSYSCPFGTQHASLGVPGEPRRAGSCWRSSTGSRVWERWAGVPAENTEPQTVGAQEVPRYLGSGPFCKGWIWSSHVSLSLSRLVPPVYSPVLLWKGQLLFILPLCRDKMWFDLVAQEILKPLWESADLI